jgi:YVTN family beta-propeller protein
MRWTTSVLVLTGLGATVAALALPFQPPSASLLVLNKGDQSLAIVDISTLSVVGRVPTGPDPHEVAVSPDGTRAYVSNYTAGNGADHTISVIDLQDRKALAPIDLGALDRPHDVVFSGEDLYFTAEGSKVVGRYDPSAGKVDWVMGTGQDRTHMVIVAPGGVELFTTNVSSGSVSIIDRATGGRGGPGRGGRGGAGDWQVTTVPVGRGAEGFDLSADGKTLWVANAQDASVSIVDVATKKVEATIPVQFRAANRLKFTPDGRLALISDLGGHELIVVDVASRRETKRVDVKGGAAGLLVTPDGARAFLSVGSQNAVAVIDLRSLVVTNWIPTGRNPDGLAWAVRQ